MKVRRLTPKATAVSEMNAFDQAGVVVEAPFHGTDSNSFKQIMSEGIEPRSFAAGYKGEKGVSENTTTTEEDAMRDAWNYAINNVMGQDGPTKPHLLYINPNHPDVDYEPDNRDVGRQFFGMPTLGDKGHVFTDEDIPVDAIQEIFEGDEYDPDGGEDPDEYYQRHIEMIEELL